MTVWKGWCRVAGGEKGSPRPPPRPSVPQSIRASEAACPHVMMTNMPVSRALSGFDNLAFQLRRLTFKVRLSGKTWNSQLQTVRRRWYLQVEGKKKKLTTGSICHLTTIKTIFSEQDIFVKVLRSPKIRYRAEGVSLKAGKKKKFAVCFLHKEWLLQSSWIQCIVWRFRTKYVQRMNEKAVGRVQSRQIQDFTENVSNSPLLVFFIVLQTRH